MKVAIKDISEEGLVLEEDIEASSWEMDSSDIKFIGDIHLVCEFKKISNGIVVKVKVVTLRDIRCSRCLEVVRRRVSQEFNFFYESKKLGEFLNIDGDIREEILLDWPMKPLCKDECRGICPGCGRNLNLEECICSKKIKRKEYHGSS